MKLIDLLAEANTEDLERIAHEHARPESVLSRPVLLQTIESVIKSYRFVQEFLFNRQPPTFAMMMLLLDAPSLSVGASGFREAALAETDRIGRAIESGEILRRDEQLRVYRRVLYQARSNDLQIDASEWSILGVLRQELEISQVEHFLIEHHPDLREFWKQDEAFVREFLALRSAGIIFVRDGQALIPEDLALLARRVLGVEMSRPCVRRVFEHLPGQDLYEALSRISAPTSGSKDERVERLVAHMVQPKGVLRHVSVETLRKICRDIGAAVSGSKDELVDRIASHVEAGRDLDPESLPPPAPVEEARSLTEAQFASLFSVLRGHQLAGILATFELRRFGTKELQIQLLWGSHRAEMSLLGCLSNAELESILQRLELKISGAKAERIARLIEYFATDEAAGLDSSVRPHGGRAEADEPLQNLR
jgi:hypothetical protein